MNKQKGIIIGILALAVTMMIGYALFSETITINGTATAKGSFDLTYTCEKEIIGTATGSCEIVDNNINTTSSFSKPDDAILYTITITNSGTIPAALKTISSPNNSSLYHPNDVAGDEAYFDKTTLLEAYYTFIGDTENIFGDAAVEAANITIQPDETITLNVVLGWTDSDSFEGLEQPKLPEAGATMNYNVTLGFEQITN